MANVKVTITVRKTYTSLDAEKIEAILDWMESLVVPEEADSTKVLEIVP